MASNETEAYKIMRMLDVDYVLVIFGGLSGYSSDDINKFLWMVSTPCDKTSPYVLAVGNGKPLFLRNPPCAGDSSPPSHFGAEEPCVPRIAGYSSVGYHMAQGSTPDTELQPGSSSPIFLPFVRGSLHQP
jgi:hypothetical protein